MVHIYFSLCHTSYIKIERAEYKLNNEIHPLWKDFILNIKDRALGSSDHTLNSIPVRVKYYFFHFADEAQEVK